MRTIKFRAWVNNRQNRYMAIQGEPDLETLQSFMFHYGTETNLMQSTGLFDKNGTEIFEDDFVKGKVYGKYIMTKVRAFQGGFCPFMTIDEKIDWSFDSLIDLEVLGNIYQNPELLSTPTAVL